MEETKEIEQIESEDSGYKYKLDKFEGPLDLLLHLIKEAKVDIKDIFVSEITEQFLAYIEEAKEYPSEVISDFIDMASTLLQIKSKKLLPVPPKEEDEDEEDPEQKLIRQLEEYKLFKEEAEKLKELEDTGKLYKAPDKLVGAVRYELKDLNFEALLDAFAHLMHKIDIKAEAVVPKEIQKDRFTVAQKISEIKDRLLEKDSFSFDSLLEGGYTKGEVINTFLALLELLKVQEIKVVQLETCGEIKIEKQTKESV